MIQLKTDRSSDNSVEPAAKGRIVTFYSYKGGTGRSMALANIAWMLALNGQRVLVIDWDLEAPGVHRYFHPFTDDKELLQTEGLIDFVENLAAQAAVSTDPLPDEAVDVIEYVHPLEWPRNTASRITWKSFGPRARIDLLTAGRQGPAYARKLAAFNWIDFYERLQGRRLLNLAKAQMRAVYDYVLIDSRTGVSDTSGICTVEMPDTLVVCFTLNDQSIRGASAVAESVCSLRKPSKTSTPVLPNDGIPFRVLPVPTRVEIISEQEKLRVALDLAQKTFSPFVDHIPVSEQSRYFGTVQMAYFPFYAFEEIPAVFGDKPNQLHSLSTAIKQLTSAITEGAITDIPRLAEGEEESEKARDEIVGWYLRKSTDPTLGHLIRFQQILASFDRSEQEETFNALSRLVQIGERDILSARSVPFDDFIESQRRVLLTLIDAKLLAITDTGGVRTVTFADAVVIDRWDDLRRWIAEHRQMLIVRQTLGAALQSWVLRDSDQSALLTGKLLAEASALARSNPGDLNEAEHRFVQQSTEIAQRQAFEAEAAQKHNEELTRKLTELEQVARSAPAPAPPPAPVTIQMPPAASRPSPWLSIALGVVVTAILIFAAYRYYDSLQRDRENARMQRQLEVEKQEQAKKQIAAAQQVLRYSNAAWDALILVPGISRERQAEYERASKWLANVQPDEARRAITVRYFTKNDKSLQRVNSLLGDTWGLLGYTVDLSNSKIPGDTNVIWAGSKVPARDVKVIACTLLRAGAPIRAVGTFSTPDTKPNVIEIGSASWAQKLPQWTVKRVLDTSAFTLTKLTAGSEEAQ